MCCPFHTKAGQSQISSSAGEPLVRVTVWVWNRKRVMKNVTFSELNFREGQVSQQLFFFCFLGHIYISMSLAEVLVSERWGSAQSHWAAGSLECCRFFIQVSKMYPFLTLVQAAICGTIKDTRQTVSLRWPTLNPHLPLRDGDWYISGIHCWEALTQKSEGIPVCNAEDIFVLVMMLVGRGWREFKSSLLRPPVTESCRWIYSCLLFKTLSTAQ